MAERERYDASLIRLIHARDREMALQALKDAGVRYKDILENTDINVSSFKTAMLSGFEVALTSIEGKVGSTLDNLVGSGTISESVQSLFGQVGAQTGRWIGSKFGSEILGQFAAPLMEFFWKTGAKVLGAEWETLRMGGAKFAPVIRGGQLGGRQENYKELGRKYLATVLEIKTATNESDEAINAVLTNLSRFGVRLDETGEKAAMYAIAADKLHLLQKGTAEALEKVAVSEYGELWEFAGKTIQDTAAQTAYWSQVADTTHSSLTRALSSNQTMIEIYTKVREATKGSGLEMMALNKVMLGTVEQLRELGGARPERISSAVADFIGKLSPQTGDLMQTIVHGTLVADLMQSTPRARDFWSQVQAYRKEKQIPALLSNVALTQFLSDDRTGDRTMEYLGALLEGTVARRDAFQGGTTEDKNMLLAADFAKRAGVDSNNFMLMLKVAEKYDELVKLTNDPKQAMARLRGEAEYGRFESITGVPFEEFLKQTAELSDNQRSAADSLALAADRLSILRGETFWPAWTEIVKTARLESERGFMGPPTPGTVAAGMGISAEPPTAGAAGGAAPSSVPQVSETKLSTGHYAKSTAGGTDIVETHVTISSHTTTTIRNMIGDVATRMFPGDPQAAARMRALARQESSFNPRAVGDSGKAHGLFQMHPELRRKYGVSLESTPEAQAMAAGKEMKELLGKHSGSWEKAVEEFHLGAPNVAKGRTDPRYMSEHRKNLSKELG